MGSGPGGFLTGAGGFSGFSFLASGSFSVPEIAGGGEVGAFLDASSSFLNPTQLLISQMAVGTSPTSKRPSAGTKSCSKRDFLFFAMISTLQRKTPRVVAPPNGNGDQAWGSLFPPRRDVLTQRLDDIAAEHPRWRG